MPVAGLRAEVIWFAYTPSNATGVFAELHDTANELLSVRDSATKPQFRKCGITATDVRGNEQSEARRPSLTEAVWRHSPLERRGPTE